MGAIQQAARGQAISDKANSRVHLGKPANALTGGWSQPHDAAARLHAAGYIIVDQNDEPLPLPEQYTHLMRGADRARLVALNYFIEPAREAGLPSVTIRAGDLHDMCGLVRNWANVCQALEGEMFQKFASVPAPTRSGPERSTTTEFTFVLAQDGAAKDETMPHAVQTATTNLILYGPPGTGKTYQTAWEAVRLCLGDEVAGKLIGEERRKQLLNNAQARATNRISAGMGNCYPAHVRSMTAPNDFSPLLAAN